MENSLKDKVLSVFDNRWVYKILISYPSLIIQAVIAAVFFHLQLPVASIVFSVILIIISIWFSRDMMPCFAPVMLCSMSVLNMYGKFIGDFIQLWPLLVFVLLGLILRPFIFRTQYKKGKMLFSTILVAISITLGGIGSISAKDYFKPVTMYYVIMLGIGMIVTYLYMVHYIHVDENHNAMTALTRSMLAVGLMGILMVLPVTLNSVFNSEELAFFQWKNNVSTSILLSMPFAFYMSCKIKNYGIVFYLFGVLQYLSLLLIQSRGGMLFGTVIFAACALCTMIFNSKNNRITIITLNAMALVLLIVVATKNWAQIKEIFDVVDIDPNEARVKMYKLAVTNFFKFPILGTGLGFVGEFYSPAKGAIYWYHSTPFQVMGSLGLVGVIAYTYQLFVRIKVCSRRFTYFNLFAFLSFAAFELMAMVNPGDFSPFPYVITLVLVLTVVEKANTSSHNNMFLKKIHEPPLYIELTDGDKQSTSSGIKGASEPPPYIAPTDREA